MHHIDFRSDTVTWPTEEMRRAMADAEVGDDVYGDDPTGLLLERLAAERVGMDAALFVPSGTMGNQLAVFTHIQRGEEVIMAEDNHIVVHEAGAAAIIAGAQLRCLPSDKGKMNPEAVSKTIRLGEDIHEPRTGLICLENAHSSGVVHDLAYMARIRDLARKAGVPVHLDGARLFNAASYLKVEASEIARHADSVMFCLSKGLCAPIGSILAGSHDFIAKARRKRKILGGGMRQIGVLASAGIIALQKMTHRVHEDHDRALYLASLLEEIPAVRVYKEDVHINMVFLELTGTCDGELLVRKLREEGILVNPPADGIMRLVTHYYTGEAEIRKLVGILKRELGTE